MRRKINSEKQFLSIIKARNTYATAFLLLNTFADNYFWYRITALGRDIYYLEDILPKVKKVIVCEYKDNSPYLIDNMPLHSTSLDILKTYPAESLIYNIEYNRIFYPICDIGLWYEDNMCKKVSVLKEPNNGIEYILSE